MLSEDFFDAWRPRVLSILRIMAALMFLAHGTGKLFAFPVVPMFANVQLFSLFGIAGVIELVGGVLLALGLFTRPVAFILSGQMAVAYFLIHAPQNFFPILNGGELAAVYSFLFLYFAVAGGGAWSLDALRQKA